jgi:hypothetical protein
MSAVAIQSANATESGTSLYLLSSKGQGVVRSMEPANC